MWINFHRDIPGYAELARRENEIRTVPFLNLPEPVAGIDCAPLTLRRLMWLSLVQSPFLTEASAEELLQKPGIAGDVEKFFWICSPEFKAGGKLARRQFNRRMRRVGLLQKKSDEIFAEIKIYMDEAMMDSTRGGADKSYFAAAAAYGVFFSNHFALGIDLWENSLWRRITRHLTGKPNPMDIPIKIARQYMRAHSAAAGNSLDNELSDGAIQRYLANLNKNVPRLN
jgi:hypothetical protein